MKKKYIPVNKLKKMIVFVGMLCVGAFMFYLVMTWYYMSRFTINTWINGIYCTGKTVEEINSEFLQIAETPSVRIIDLQGREYEITAQELFYSVDYTEALRELLASQKAWRWPVGLFERKELTASPKTDYDEEVLHDFWESLSCVREAHEDDASLSILWTEEGYLLKDMTEDRLDIEAGFTRLKDAVENGRIEMNLVDEELYRAVETTEEQKQILAQWEKVKDFQKLEIIFDMGDEQIVLNQSNIGEFLIREEDGNFLEEEDGSLAISRDKTDAFIDSLADEYDTYKKERTFVSTRGDMITLAKGSYGTLLNREAEKKYLYDALVNRISEVHVPEYEREAYHRGLNDIGNTYIEIDMTDQKMYLYKEGECLVETDIVTGNMSKRWGTPEGVYYVYAKQKNRILRGQGYASPVKFWMPVNGNIGIHDAGWRNKFGGEIYKTSGSHGCINTPYENMKTIYEEVEVGVPVVMFY
ncbi:MAG: L,D-transpeptidase family protein [Lachnospiraceae bacterium]|nr:L,D-transpeptidase family protein [Lachnospiraceae bacterium]